MSARIIVVKSFNVLPCVTAPNIVDGGFIDVVFASENVHILSNAAAYFPDLILCEFALGVFLPARHNISALGHLVCAVVLDRPKKQMVRVHAWRVVASMEHLQTVGNRSHIVPPRPPVRSNGSPLAVISLNPEVPVPITVGNSRPHVAGRVHVGHRRSICVDLRHESFKGSSEWGKSPGTPVFPVVLSAHPMTEQVEITVQFGTYTLCHVDPLSRVRPRSGPRQRCRSSFVHSHFIRWDVSDAV